MDDLVRVINHVQLLLIMQASLAATGLALLAWWRNFSVSSSIQYAVFSIAVQFLLVLDHGMVFPESEFQFPQIQAMFIAVMVMSWLVLIVFSPEEKRAHLKPVTIGVLSIQIGAVLSILVLQFLVTGHSLLPLSRYFTLLHYVPDRVLGATLLISALSLYANICAAALLWVTVIYGGMQAVRYLRRGQPAGRAVQMGIFIRIIRMSLLVRMMTPIISLMVMTVLYPSLVARFKAYLVLESGWLILIRFLLGVALPLLVVNYAAYQLDEGHPRTSAVSLLTLPGLILIAEILAAGLTVGWWGVGF